MDGGVSLGIRRNEVNRTQEIESEAMDVYAEDLKSRLQGCVDGTMIGDLLDCSS